MRLSDATRQQIREAERWLAGIEDGQVPVLPQFLERMQELLDTDATVGFGIARQSEGFEIEGFASAGSGIDERPLLPELARWFGGSTRRWALWTPTRPEPAQRNKVFNVGRYERTLLSAADPATGISRKIGLAKNAVADAVAGLERVASLPEIRRQVITRHQLRVLVCDGPSLLAWVGALQDEGFTGQQIQLLRALAEPLQRRLALERQLGQRQLFASALPLAMEAIAGSAFLVGANGALLHANTPGQRWADADLIGLRESIRDSLQGLSGEPDFTVTPVQARGMPACFLLVQTRRQGALVAASSRARQRWGLTARELEVLDLIARGEPNKSIAAGLGCSVRTVELHVTHILAKAGASSRAELVALLADLA